jgi:hypothetical protein
METLVAAWWLWVLLGLALLAGEILTPGGFYILFFGAGAIAVGLLKLAGVSMGLAMEGLAFVAISITALVLFRRPLMQRFKPLAPEARADELTSEVAVALEEIGPRSRGKVELRGTAWNAQNLGDLMIVKSARCRVERVDGLTLEVRAIDQ